MQLVVMSEFVSERFLCSVVEDIKRMKRERERVVVSALVAVTVLPVCLIQPSGVCPYA